MIATRFRSVYWVGGVAIAALSCYLVSQRVAAERAHLAKVETAIVLGERQIRSLETEIGTRAGMKQIERWNVDVLALSAPKAAQFVTTDAQLASLVQPVQPAMDAPAAVQVALAEDDAAPAEMPRVTRASFEAPVVAASHTVAPARTVEAKPDRTRPDRAAAKPKAEADKAKPQPTKAKLQTAEAKPKPKAKAAAGNGKALAKREDAATGTRERAVDTTPRVRSTVFVPAPHKASPIQKVALLDDRLLGDLGKIARDERTGGKRNR